MIKYNKELIDAVYNKRTEIHYNEYYSGPEIQGRRNKIELKGKIKCPVLNTNISSLTCSKLMDRKDWPRGIDNQVCKNCNCFINLSILKLKNNKLKEITNEPRK